MPCGEGPPAHQNEHRGVPRCRAIAVLVLVAAPMAWLTAAGASASVAGPDIASEASFVRDTNAARAGQGLAALQVSGDLVSIARQHSQEMASRQQVYDDPAIGVEVQDWQAVGENAGTGPSVAAVEQAFMASAPHRANILGAYGDTGVGVVWAGSALWVTEVYRRPVAPPAPHSAGPTLRSPISAPAPEHLVPPLAPTPAPRAPAPPSRPAAQRPTLAAAGIRSMVVAVGTPSAPLSGEGRRGVGATAGSRPSPMAPKGTHPAASDRGVFAVRAALMAAALILIMGDGAGVHYLRGQGAAWPPRSSKQRRRALRAPPDPI